MSIESTLPNQITFSLKQLQDLGLFRVSTAKKLIITGQLEAVKIGVKLFVLRAEVIRYFNDNIVSPSVNIEM